MKWITAISVQCRNWFERRRLHWIRRLSNTPWKHQKSTILKQQFTNLEWLVTAHGDSYPCLIYVQRRAKLDHHIQRAAANSRRPSVPDFTSRLKHARSSQKHPQNISTEKNSKGRKAHSKSLFNSTTGIWAPWIACLPPRHSRRGYNLKLVSHCVTWLIWLWQCLSVILSLKKN